MISQHWDWVYIGKFSPSGDEIWYDCKFGTGDAKVYGIDLDSEGNIYISGYFGDQCNFGSGVYTPAGSADGYLCKYDPDGNYIWSAIFAGDHSTTLEDIAVSDTDDIYVCGGFHVTTDFDPGPGEEFLSSEGDRDMFLGRYDKNGSLQWVSTMGGALSNFRNLNINLNAEADSFITGIFYGTVDFDPGPGIDNREAGPWGAFLSSYSQTGAKLWVNSWDSVISTEIIGSYYSCDFGVDGSIFFTGTFDGTADLDPGEGTNYRTAQGIRDAFLMKIPLDGQY